MCSCSACSCFRPIWAVLNAARIESSNGTAFKASIGPANLSAVWTVGAARDHCAVGLQSDSWLFGGPLWLTAPCRPPPL